MKSYYLHFLKKGFIIALLSGCSTTLKESTGPFEIPSEAKFEILSYRMDSSPNQQADNCQNEKPTEEEIKRQFRIAHELSPKDLHDNYIWSPCYAEGTISKDGKVMKWRFRIGNVIETTFPDEKEKSLGGEPSDSPAGD